MKEKRDLFICGDVHGKLKELVYQELKNKWKIKDADIVVAGDFGIGFGGPCSGQVAYDKVKAVLEEHNVTIYAVRGNHDDPSWFDGEHDFERLKFLPDYVPITLSGRTILPVGGATSLDIDRKDQKGKTRRMYNDSYIRYGSRKRCWWPEEHVKEPPKGLPIRVDIIVSHEAPLGFLPVAIRPSDVNYEVWNRALKDRQILDKVQYEVFCKWWFYGHYHEHNSGHVGDMLYRCLRELELFEIRE